jgi:TFIIF-interacting CTD phosphatase-like protein
MKAPILNPGEASAPANINQKPNPGSKETTRGPKPKEKDHNFSQSRDIREDRGTRQIKNSARPQSAPRGR